MATRLSTDLYTNIQNIELLLSRMNVLHYEHTGRLVEKVCSLLLSKSGAIWHINVPKVSSGSSNNRAIRDADIAACLSK